MKQVHVYSCMYVMVMISILYTFLNTKTCMRADSTMYKLSVSTQIAIQNLFMSFLPYTTLLDIRTILQKWYIPKLTFLWVLLVFY